jgi:DNA repair exonuclease SbcCD ATPase subunit
MRPPAHVTSLDLLRDWLAALMTFRSEAQDALTSAQLDVRRAFDWLTETQKSWQRAIRERQDEVTTAKAALTRKKWVLPGQREPDITEEMKALRRAQRRLEEAEDKLACTRRWQPALQRAVDEFDGPIRRLADLLDGELPKAGERLDRLLRDLEAYLSVRAGAPPASPSIPESS